MTAAGDGHFSSPFLLRRVLASSESTNAAVNSQRADRAGGVAHRRTAARSKKAPGFAPRLGFPWWEVFLHRWRSGPLLPSEPDRVENPNLFHGHHSVGYGAGTVIEGLTDAEELAVASVSSPASAAAFPAPLALADVPSPSLLASALPLANELLSAVPAAASVDPSEPASICAKADAEPSPAEVADTSTLAEDDAVAVPSSLVAALAASAAPVPLIDPPPVVNSSMSASAADAEVAELTSAVASVVPAAKAWPEAVPSPLDV